MASSEQGKLNEAQRKRKLKRLDFILLLRFYFCFLGLVNRLCQWDYLWIVPLKIYPFFPLFLSCSSFIQERGLGSKSPSPHRWHQRERGGFQKAVQRKTLFKWDIVEKWQFRAQWAGLASTISKDCSKNNLHQFGLMLKYPGVSLFSEEINGNI